MNHPFDFHRVRKAQLAKKKRILRLDDAAFDIRIEHFGGFNGIERTVLASRDDGRFPEREIVFGKRLTDDNLRGGPAVDEDRLGQLNRDAFRHGNFTFIV